MDALISQLADLEPAQRWSLLCRLARTHPADVQHALGQIRRAPRRDIVVHDWQINGVDRPEPESVLAS